MLAEHGAPRDEREGERSEDVEEGVHHGRRADARAGGRLPSGRRAKRSRRSGRPRALRRGR
eukprot:5418682-Alexandrium_andersonii.AAC.1